MIRLRERPKMKTSPSKRKINWRLIWRSFLDGLAIAVAIGIVWAMVALLLELLNR